MTLAACNTATRHVPPALAPTTSDASAGGDGSLSVHARLGRHTFGACVRWPTSGAPLGSQSLSGVAAKRLAGWSPEAGREAVSGRADGAGTGAGAAARRTRKDRRNAPGVGVGIRRCARPWSAFCCTSLSRRRASFLWTCCSSSAPCSSSPRRSSSSLSARSSSSWSCLALSLAERLASSLAAERLASALWRT